MKGPEANRYTELMNNIEVRSNTGDFQRKHYNSLEPNTMWYTNGEKYHSNKSGIFK